MKSQKKIKVATDEHGRTRTAMKIVLKNAKVIGLTFGKY